MGVKAKKAMKKSLKKATAKLSVPSKKTEGDFLPLEGGPARKLPEQKLPENTATVLYIGRIPHGFYEKEMEGFFGQFGTIKKLRIARNKKTGKSKHFGFIQFESPEVAKIVAETMHNYLLYEHILQVHLIPPEDVHPKFMHSKVDSLYMDFDESTHYTESSPISSLYTLKEVSGPPLLKWRGFNYRNKPLDSVQIERKRLRKERTLDEQQKLVEKILKRNEKRRKRIEAAGIDYECPEIVGSVQPGPKKIKFED